MKTFIIYAQQTTDYRIEIKAETLEEAENIAKESDPSDWREVGELGWDYLWNNTEIFEKDNK